MDQIRIDRTPRRIRAELGGTTVADSTDARLGYATGQHPQYLLPASNVAWDDLDVDQNDHKSDAFGDFHTVRRAAGEGQVGRSYVTGHAKGLVHFDFDAMDAWFEEDEQIWFHARDPYRRVDVTESSRHVEITVNGATVARSDRPRLVTETALPERWYVPRADVDWSALTPSDTESACQYKGIASWFDVEVGGERLVDVAWGYERPVGDAPKLAGLVAFYAEHAAVETYVEGTAQPKPRFEPGWLNPSFDIPNIAAA
jgi:uncharacterized protein (DUF427 family)